MANNAYSYILCTRSFIHHNISRKKILYLRVKQKAKTEREGIWNLDEKRKASREKRTENNQSFVLCSISFHIVILDHLLVVFTATAWHAAAAIAVVDSVTSFLVGSILAKAP